MSFIPLTNLSKLARQLLDDTGLTQEDVVRLSGLDKSAISRLLNSDIRNSPDKLDALLTAFPDPDHQYQLVTAHLQDELSPHARECIRILPCGKATRTAPLQLHHLSTLGREALRYLLRNQHIESILIDLARAIGWQPNSKTTPTAGGGGGPLPLVVEIVSSHPIVSQSLRHQSQHPTT